jgi:hypothetical protein
MADDKSKRGMQDRNRISGSQGYEVDYLAKKHSISKAVAEQLIKQHGNNRAVLDQEGEKLKR